MAQREELALILTFIEMSFLGVWSRLTVMDN